MSITLEQLRLQCKQKADRETSEFVQDTELDTMINYSIAELHDLLIAHAGADYYLSEHDFTTVVNTEAYNLPADFYKLKGVDFSINGEWRSLRPFNFNERNRITDDSWSVLSAYNVRYRLWGNTIKFSPAPESAVNARLWYVPTATKLVNASDVLANLDQWIEYVIVDVAIKYLLKEESDVQVLMMQKADLRKRIENMSANRDEGQPESISDIYAENNNMFWRGQS
jgi:hypothetical protein